MEKYIVKPVIELHSLIPDSILFGSLFLYFLTQNMSFGVFSLFLVEIVLSHRFLSWMISQSVGPSRPSGNMSCRAGFKTARYEYDRVFSHDAYPSYSVFSVTSIATYLGLATNLFSSTMEEMGPEWASRSTVAYTLILLFLLAFLLARGYACEPTNEIMIAFVLAVVVGAVFFMIHKAVFGEEAMNFLGLPYLVRKDEKGSPIYVCGPISPPPTATPST